MVVIDSIPNILCVWAEKRYRLLMSSNDFMFAKLKKKKRFVCLSYYTVAHVND